MPAATSRGIAVDVIQGGIARLAPFRTSTQLRRPALADSERAGPIRLDLHRRTGCVSCTEMERFTFSDPRRRGQAGRHSSCCRVDSPLLNSAQDKALLSGSSVVAPPGTILFRSNNGREGQGAR